MEKNKDDGGASYSVMTSVEERQGDVEDVQCPTSSAPFHCSPSQVGKEEIILAHQLEVGNSLQTPDSPFHVELHTVSQADQHMSTLWFTTSPLRGTQVSNAFHGLGVQTLPCHGNEHMGRDSTVDLVQVCLPLSYHSAVQNHLQSTDALSMGCATPDESGLDQKKLTSELSGESLKEADPCNAALDSATSIYCSTPSGHEMASAKSVTYTHLAEDASVLEDTAAHCILRSPDQVSLVGLGNGSGQVNSLDAPRSHLQAEIVYRDSNGDVSLSTATVQIPIIRASDKEEFAKSSEELLCVEDKTSHPQIQSKENGEGGKCLEGFVETVECFKCKLCPFISLNKKGVQAHVQNDHAQICQQSEDSEEDEEGDEAGNSDLGVNELEDNDLTAASLLIKQGAEDVKKDNFSCGRCGKGFSDLKSCNQHLAEHHDLKCDLAKLETIINTMQKRKIRTKKSDKAGKSGNCTSQDSLMNTRRKQKVPRKMHSLDSDSDEAAVPQKKKLRQRNQEATNDSAASDKNQEAVKSGTSTLKKRGRPKGSKNTGITAMRRKNPKLKVEEELGYRCDIDDCAIRMKSVDNLEYHRRCHVKTVSGFTCPECHEKFDHWRNISVHLWRTHVIDMELYACDQCSYKTYSFSKLINMHKRIHSEDRPFLCDNCGKGFKTSKQLRNHKVIHLDKRRQRSFRSGECDVCHRFFSDKRMLRVHKDTVHNKLRPFLCNYCGYAASCRSTLKMHMRQHTGEKPFSCTYCAYRTADHNSLRRHKMRHSGEKPYKCPFCPYACIQSSTYKTHLKNKHPGQDEGLMYSCNLCAFRTIKKENYITHMADHKAGTIAVNAEQSTILVDANDKVDSCSSGEQTALLVQSQSVPTLTQLDRLPSNLTTAQVMFSTIEEIRNKIAVATQGFPLDVSQMDRYPIIVGQLKTNHLDNTTVVHIDPNIQLDPSQQQFLVQEQIGETDHMPVMEVSEHLQSETTPTTELQ